MNAFLLALLSPLCCCRKMAPSTPHSTIFIPLNARHQLTQDVKHPKPEPYKSALQYILPKLTSQPCRPGWLPGPRQRIALHLYQWLTEPVEALTFFGRLTLLLALSCWSRFNGQTWQVQPRSPSSVEVPAWLLAVRRNQGTETASESSV